MRGKNRRGRIMRGRSWTNKNRRSRSMRDKLRINRSRTHQMEEQEQGQEEQKGDMHEEQ